MSTYIRGQSIQNGLLFEMARHIGVPQITGGLQKLTQPESFHAGFSHKFKGCCASSEIGQFTRMLQSAAVGRIHTGQAGGGQTKSICVEDLSASKESFDRTMREATVFMGLPTEAPKDHKGSTSAWSELEKEIKQLDLHRSPSAHATHISHSLKSWLKHEVMLLDQAHFNGFLKHHALLVGCAPLPSTPVSAPEGLTMQSLGGTLLTKGGGR
jgi:hypothetical protein